MGEVRLYGGERTICGGSTGWGQVTSGSETWEGGGGDLAAMLKTETETKAKWPWSHSLSDWLARLCAL